MTSPILAFLFLTAAGCDDLEADLGEETAELDQTAAATACGDGTAQPGELCFQRRTIRLPDQPAIVQDALAGDMDGDRDLDLLAAAEGIHVLRNRGDGTFARPGSAATEPNYALDLELGDVDGDGDLDVAAASGFGGPRLYLNDGRGALEPAPGLLLGFVVDSNELQVQDVALGDMDGDSDLDMVLATLQLFAGAGGIVVLDNPGTPSGTWMPTTIPAPIKHPNGIAVADLDDDGQREIAVVHDHSSVTVLRRDGATYLALSTIPVANSSYSIVASDLDGDGDVDLAIPGDDITTLFNQGALELTTRTVPVRGWSGDLTAADMDLDGEVDLAAQVQDLEAFDGVEVRRGLGGGRFGSARRLAGSAASIHAAQIDGRHLPDLVMARSFEGDLRLLLSNP